MNTYEQLQDEVESNKIIFREKDFRSNAKGLYKNKRIAINSRINTSTEKSCILAEELGHYYTSVGNILDLKKANNTKQEYHARFWGYNRLIGLNGIINAYKNKCKNLNEMAEFLGVTELFLLDAIDCYRGKYGICVTVDNYIVYFEPLGIVEMIN